MLSADGAANVDAGRVRIALTACGPALENARLQAVLNSHLRAARASRARIVQAAIAERRKLARDLHDGAQQHLHALSTSLVLARQKTSQPQAVAAIDAAREQLRGALRKLRGIGRDLYPVLLDSEGLAAALDSLADDGPLDVDVICETGRRDPEAEMVMYLTVREILAGLAGQSGPLAATRAAVVVIAADGRMSLRVTSDGRLDSEAGLPTWLSVVIDRIEADGGALGVKSGADQISALGGICMEAWIPFA
jgi:signal transduction histidine kinase